MAKSRKILASLEALTCLTAIRPLDFPLRILQFVLCRKCGQDDEAQEIYRFICQTMPRPERAPLYVDLASKLHEHGLDEEAFNMLQRIQGLPADSSAYYLAKADLLMSLGKAKAAIRIVDQMIAQSAGVPYELIARRGAMREMAGDFGRALQDYTSVLQANAAFVNLFYRRASIRLKLAHRKAALRDYSLYFHSGGARAYGDPEGIAKALSRWFPNEFHRKPAPSFDQKQSAEVLQAPEPANEVTRVTSAHIDLNAVMSKPCQHGVPSEDCPVCASWGWSYAMRWDD